MSREYILSREKHDEELMNQLIKEMPDFIRDYKRNMDAKGMSTGTQLTYLREIRRFFEAVASYNEIDFIKNITLENLEELKWDYIEAHIVDAVNGKKPAAKTRLHRLDCIRSLYNYLNKAELIVKNPAAIVDTPKTPQKEVNYLNPSQIKAFIGAIEKLNVDEKTGSYKTKAYYRDRAIMTTLLGTGMRVSELVGLNISDFDTTIGGFHVIRKGGDEDIATFGNTVETAINEYLDCGRPLFGSPKAEQALFLSTHKKRITVRSVELLVKKYAKEAGLSDSLHPHTMRASFATNVYKETQDIYAIKNALHHSSLETSKHYIGDEEKSKRKASSAMDSLL